MSVSANRMTTFFRGTKYPDFKNSVPVFSKSGNVSIDFSK